MKVVVISGLPRSGTSWVAKALSFDPSFTLYREPDNSEFVPGAPEKSLWNKYLRKGVSIPAYDGHIARALRGEIATNFTMKENPGPIFARLPVRLHGLPERFPQLYMRKRNVIVKFVHTNLALDWMSGCCPEARIVSLIRHPVGQFESWLRLGWVPEPKMLLNDAQLVDEYLAPFVELIRRADSFWAKAGAYWGAINHVAYRQTASGAAHSSVPFEWLCQDAPLRMRELSERLDMQWTSDAGQFVKPVDGSVDGESFSLSRDSQAQITKWREVVDTDDIAECRTFAEPFGVPLYADFDPWNAEPLWGSSALRNSTDS